MLETKLIRKFLERGSCDVCILTLFLVNAVLISSKEQATPCAATKKTQFGTSDNESCSVNASWQSPPSRQRWVETFESVPEQHPYRSPRKWFLWAPLRSSRPCRSSGYKSRPRAGWGGNISSWRTERHGGNKVQFTVIGKWSVFAIKILLQQNIRSDCE